jgi:hypothetical protein
MQLDEVLIRPSRITLAPVAKSGEYRKPGVFVAAQENSCVIGRGVADNRADGRFEHVRVHSKCSILKVLVRAESCRCVPMLKLDAE